VEEDLSLSAASPLRAPSENGGVLARPRLDEAGELLRANRRRTADLAEVRRQACREAVAAARDYLRQCGEPLPDISPDTADRLILAGHQPELFHPGVWVKNFALNGLARHHGRIPLNLVVDNDNLKTPGLRVPALPGPDEPGDTPRLASVLFDRWSGEVPYEEHEVADRALFASFAERVTALMRGWPFEPILPELWAHACRRLQETPLLGECLAAARRACERAWGCHNLELPLSALCRTPSFHRFAGEILRDLPRLHSLYNAAVHDFRRRYGIRSRHHPVPDLAAQDGWLEAPLWGWKLRSRRRGRLFARNRAGRIELRADAERWPDLPADDGQCGELSAAIGALEARGYKVRSRALTTTLYSRLFLADLFLHGIGGAKYDELTDDLIRRFYQREQPAYLTLSATLWLPVHHESARELLLQRRRTAWLRRDVNWNPQRHLDALPAHDDALRSLAAAKREWIAWPAATKAERRTRFENLRNLTAKLAGPLASREAELVGQIEDLDRRRVAAAVLERRDYAFCLYPAAALRPFVTPFLSPPSAAASQSE
jgi:hypothetical protein